MGKSWKGLQWPVLALRVQCLGFSNPRLRMHAQEVPRGQHPRVNGNQKPRAMRGIDWEVRLMRPRALFPFRDPARE
ncbi:hypothetical protein B0T18DRAFT_417666 [Schizothecium vesticola]|uniref:Uncharacterized protein n=1 Tax=Schizothecium vesticola TaxID=314040 RepID=A0AA40EJ59_9PEZI|nr:hypothetical protein B0T18DRAFT_417666 [Schizothecium vesticola]